MRLIIPTDHLSDSIQTPERQVRWILPAPPGGATIVDFFFTYVPEPRAREYYGTRSNEELITYFALPTGEFFGIACSHGTYDRDDLIIESHGDQSDDLIFPRQATQSDGRAVRLLLS